MSGASLSFGAIVCLLCLPRLAAITSAAGAFTNTFNGASPLPQTISLPGGSRIVNSWNTAGLLYQTALNDPSSTALDSFAYSYDVRGQRQFATRNGVSLGYGYDPAGQLTSAVASGRANENFGYGYDPAGNLHRRTNNTLEQTFTTDAANELTGIIRNSKFTIAGELNSAPDSLTINGQTADIYGDLTFATPGGVDIVNGTNTFTAVISQGGMLMTNSFQKFLPASVSSAYDANGNLTSDGLHGYEYDYANQLTAITVTNAWRSEFVHDGFGRRRIRRE
jgi:YD repeat-containing protein